MVVPVSAQDIAIFSEPFTDNSNNWQLESTGAKTDNTFTISNGALSIVTTGASQINSLSPEVLFPDNIDVQVNLSVPNVDSGTDWYAGIGIRAEKQTMGGTYYLYSIISGSSWAFSVVESGNVRVLKKGSLSQPSSGQQSIPLRLRAEGNKFTLFYNNKLAAEVVDSTIVTNAEPKYMILWAANGTKSTSTSVEFRRLTVSSVISAPTSTSTPTSGPSVKPSATVASSKGAVLLQDDFSNNNNGWPILKDTTAQIALDGGFLSITSAKPDQIYLVNPKSDFPSDVDVTLTAKSDETNLNYAYGIAVREYTTSDKKLTYYLFRVFGNGTYSLLARQGGNTIKTLIPTHTLASFDPTKVHKLRIIAIGTTLTIYVDDNQVGSVKDSSFDTPARTSVDVVVYNPTDSASTTVQFSSLLIRSSK